ncbi:N-acetylmuramoyl-L-alanine amidase [Deinococcus wulumuqiensis]|uniref:N-acetylmuramoyl-L-alanine amidase n=4 Tax=Deinococcus wulumuqiensis TaxID=980427 RepID=A0AAV4KBR6_9DEIO|nr:N-acetylmuramoyl-L-alanine amidase [Deinococcus wulumuqiensis]QII21513.1 N-acetylmuramoyl-L-alanine amidase [Deinococcus wulumuqiensis R12]GGI90066.1 N-acetylmuramoyl-L-alanine amidase [Deinococcus wulumuqiensis]GGP30687.1 N-acetylmuramoyl-L-alanine amidase [Deinococcus wulumuqiensis]
MKLPAMLLSSALLLGSWAAAQTDPFLRTAPAQVKPTVRGAAVGGVVPAAAPVRASANSSKSSPAPAGGAETLAQAKTPSFGSPRISGTAEGTKLVFDLPKGMTYTLVPTFGGLRIDVGGVRVVPASALRLAEHLTEYRASSGQIIMGTPFPLSLSDGWRATEATIASGSRVLIVELGPRLRGGAGNVGGRVLAAAPADARAQASLQAPVPVTDTAAGSVHTTDLPPGDSVRQQPGTPPPAPPAPLPGADTARPSTLVGRIPGPLSSGATIQAPRIGKTPGVTRMVLDLPPGAGYRIVPGTLGLRVELLGVGLGSTPTNEQDTSAEVRSWRYEPSSEGVNLSIVTGSPTTSRSGWRAQVLPPLSGERSRLVLDISPAMANLTPLAPREKTLAAVPPMSASSGAAVLSLRASSVRPRVVIDPGHGGKDPGAVGTIVEKVVTLDVAKRVRDLLVAAGVDAVLTRDTDRELHPDKNTDLQMRAKMGTPGTQMFVSIHVNATEASTALKGYGIETWWNPNHDLSYQLATVLQRDMVDMTGAFNRGIKGYRSLSVLRNSRIPAALVEIGFTSHPVDGQNLTDNNYLERVSVGIASGIREALMTGVSASGKPAASAMSGP